MLHDIFRNTRDEKDNLVAQIAVLQYRNRRRFGWTHWKRRADCKASLDPLSWDMGEATKLLVDGDALISTVIWQKRRPIEALDCEQSTSYISERSFGLT